MSRAFPSWKQSILTEIFLCHACSYHETEDANARAGGTSAGSARGGVISLQSLDLGGVLSRPLGDDLSLQPTQQSALHPNAAIATMLPQLPQLRLLTVRLGKWARFSLNAPRPEQKCEACGQPKPGAGVRHGLPTG
eukprot:COSAG01_NODE_1965_length_8779_cov_5.132604_13_plen_136_part_00